MLQKSSEILAKATIQLNDYLLKHSLRQTPERYVLLRSICQLKQFSVEQLLDSISELQLSRATVYNSLSLFTQAGIILKLERPYGARATMYELQTAELSSHIQIICQQCGRISEVKDSTVLRMLMDKKFTNFAPQRFSLYVYGHCKVCRKKLVEKNKN